MEAPRPQAEVPRPRTEAHLTADRRGREETGPGRGADTDNHELRVIILIIIISAVQPPNNTSLHLILVTTKYLVSK